MTEFRLTHAQARVLREIVHGTTAHKEVFTHYSFARNPKGPYHTSVTALVDPMEAAGLIQVRFNHNGWQLGWEARAEGIQALADYDKKYDKKREVK